MPIPEGYECSEKDRLEKVCKLEKALYSLKVSPKRWYIKFTSTLEQMEFKVYSFRSRIYWWRRTSKEGKNKYVIMLLYVNNIVRIKSEKQRRLNKEFEITDLGKPKRFLGIKIERNESKHTIFIHQT